MIIEVKKLYNGFASIRDYKLIRCRRKGEDLTIVYEGKEMTVPLKELYKPFQLHDRKQKSKYGGTYELYDFKFRPDDEPLPVYEKKEDNQMTLL